MSNEIAIDEGRLGSTISDLSKVGSDVIKSLNDMSKIVPQIAKCVEGDIETTIKEKFSEYEDLFPTITNNIEAFVSDFEKVNSRFNEEQSSVSVKEKKDKMKEGGDIIHVKD